MMSTFEKTLREQMRNAEYTLDDSVALQLVNARRQALSAKRRFQLPRLALPRLPLPRLLAPALGMITASVIALVLVVSPLDDKVQHNGTADYLSPENTAFYEDLDFFYWLSESESAKRS